MIPINTDVWSKSRNMAMTVVAHSDEGGHWLYRKPFYGNKPWILYEPSRSQIRALRSSDFAEVEFGLHA